MTSPPAELRAHQGRRAGLVSRFLADAVDLMVVVGAVAILYLCFGAFRFVVHEGNYRWPVPGAAAASTASWVMLVVYLTLGWSGTGRTVGKQVLGLRVVDRHGARVRFGAALARSLLSVMVPVGLLWCAVSRERRSLADEVLRTSVVYDWSHRIPPHA